MKLNFENTTINIIRDEIIEAINGRNVIVFGAGESGTWAKDLLQQKGIEVCSFCDNSKAKQGKSKDGILIRSFEEAIELYPDACVCISSMYYQEIANQINNTRPDILNKTFNILSTMNWETINHCFVSEEGRYIKDHLKDFEMVYDDLADSESKEVLENILNYRLTRDSKYIEIIKSNNTTYLDPDVLTSSAFERIYNGVIIDGGAFDGDTVELFIDKLSDSNKKIEIHAYEISEENCEKIRKLNLGDNVVKVFRKALWCESNKKVNSKGEGLSGGITISDEYDKEGVETFCLDDYLQERISFVKLDVEGAEREVLKGSLKMIERCNPILAISVYHLQDDIIILHKIIRNLRGGYKWYLRHYLYSSGETVLYGIPYDTLNNDEK